MDTYLKKILLVEDDLKDVELTMNAMEMNNLANEVDIVNDGAEALDYLYYRGKYADRETKLPTVILLDLKMPKLDGIEVLKQIRSDDNLKKIPVVILTSSKEDPDVDKCYELGVNAYVVKPVIFKEFIDSVKELGLFWAVINVPPKECVD